MGRRGRPTKPTPAAKGSQFCAHLNRICLKPKVDGQRYCIQHILDDRRAPFRHCTFVHSGRRCTNAANKVERGETPLCEQHKRTSRNVEERHQREIAENDNIEPTMEQMMSRALAGGADSDTESIDACQDIFRHASIYTEEEAARILRDKMVKLRALYIEQFQHLKYLLKEKRLKYVQEHRKEMQQFLEQPSSSSIDSPETPKKSIGLPKIRDKNEYLKLRAMLRYQKLYGSAALLDQKARAKMQHLKKGSAASCSSTGSGTTSENIQQPRQICIFSKNFQPCTNSALPLSPYCRQHILYDKSQVLFRPCAGGNPPCLTPVISYTRKNTCLLHSKFNTQIQPTAIIISQQDTANVNLNNELQQASAPEMLTEPETELASTIQNLKDLIGDPVDVSEDLIGSLPEESLVVDEPMAIDTAFAAAENSIEISDVEPATSSFVS